MSHGIAWQIGGTAGEGLESAGEIFAQALARAGQRPSTGRDFPSRIRGGDTTFTVRLTPGGHLAPPARIDVALAFNATVLPRMQARLGADGLLLADDGIDGATSFPFTALATEAGDKRAKNMVALGASAALLDAPLEPIQQAISDRFLAKGEETVRVNRAAFDAGHALAVERFGALHALPEAQSDPAHFLSGNQAFSIGALDAGCRTAAAYPITPASDILEFLTPRLTSMGGTAIQMEDEMAALGVCIGAGFAGQRAVTATSGPGLSLMTEMIGLAEATETPVVIANCQRPGPSTGMPTKHGQEDVLAMCHGGHGEGVRIVLAPTDVADAHRIAVQAFDLADRFHCPALVALDQQLSLMKQTVGALDAAPAPPRDRPTGPATDAWAGTFEPYGDPGEAPVAKGRPGEHSGMHLANSTEHGPSGLTTEDPVVRTAMVQRRLDRLAAIPDAMDDAVVVEGDGSTAIVSFGSTVGACREAMQRRDGLRTVAVRLLHPFPSDAVAAALDGADRILVVEANATGQFETLLRANLPFHDRIVPVRRFDGNPITSDDILEAA